ncbi:MAG: DNA-processing protein DprA [Candidatus Omnitrophica bacterium]|nr:DNA-processing protein DprA [Candidatus Omnitrophota bacterium]
MNHFEAFLSLNMVYGLGSIRLKKLLDYFDKPQDILNASQDKLISIAGIGPQIANQIRNFKKEALDKELALIAKYNLQVITLDDNRYPQSLKQIPDPPIVLYVKGRLKDSDCSSIAIVGSRRASFYGLEQARDFAYSLSKQGFTIISGLARGIDTQAHKGALAAGGRTIAIMGSGFKYMYPTENRNLAEEISENGAVISEFPIETKPLRQNFPRRNRVISGLSLGVLVVEAAQNSGALITVDFALEQGREVFALPGKVDSLNSFGTNNLIRQGAKLVCCSEDILEEFGSDVRQSLGTTTASKELKYTPESKIEDTQELTLYNLISSQAISWEEIVEALNMDTNKISAFLLDLQLKRLIKQLPGNRFIRSGYEN